MNEQKTQAESIANIIQRFESFQQTPQRASNEDIPPRPITAPPNLPGNHKTLVQRKDELITKLCEEVCFLNSQIVELNDSKVEVKSADNINMKSSNYTGRMFDDNYFMISGAVSPMEEISANFAAVAEKHLHSKDIPVLDEKKDYIGKLLSPQNDSLSGYNKLSCSPKLSNLTEDTTSLNLKLSSDEIGDVMGEEGRLHRKHFTSSHSDIENCRNYEEHEDLQYRTSSRDPTCNMMSSTDSLLNSEELFCGSDGSTPQNTRGLQRFGGFENLFEAEEDVHSSEAPADRVQECVAKCDWMGEASPRGANRTLHSYDEMTEWCLSNSDLAHDNCSTTSSEIPDNSLGGSCQDNQNSCNDNSCHDNSCHDNNILSNGFHNGYQSESHGNRGLHDCLEKSQDHCDRMLEEFKQMKKYLQTMSDHVYQAPLLASSHLACSRELLDNDSDRSSSRHSVAESPWGSDTEQPEVEQENKPEFRINRLKKAKSSVRLFASKQADAPRDSITIRQIVRDVCAEEAVSDAAVLRVQLFDKSEEIEQLHSENDDLVSSISGLDTRIDDLSEQLSKLQALNRSLQAQNFNLSTTLSHKDLTFDKLKKYLHKGPPSRSQSTSPLTSIPEVSPNSAHKYGFLNRSSQSISRRKSIRPWKRRLTVLDNNNLSIYKVETVESLIPISSIIDIKTDDKKSYGKHVIIIRTDDNKEHFLQANSTEDMLEWVTRIENLIA